MASLQKSEPKNVPSWLYKNSKILLIFFLVITFALIIPFISNDSNEIANQNPNGAVFDLQETINQTFESPLHGQWAIAESRTGDILTAESLNEILINQNTLIDADSSGLLTPGTLKKQPYLAKYFNPTTQTQTVAVISVANVVENILQNDPRLNTNLNDKCFSLDQFQISDTLPIIKNCKIAVCNDSSFSHLSAALGIKTIVLMADTPLMYGSYNKYMHAILPDGEKNVTHNTLGKNKINSKKIFNKFVEIVK